MTTRKATNKDTFPEQIREFISGDYEQAWTMVRHGDSMRFEWLKFYFSLITATSGLLMGIFSFSNTNMSFINFIFSNSIILLALLFIIETAGILTLVFHFYTRVRNIRLLNKIDTIRAYMLSQSDLGNIENQLNVSPKWVSYWGTDATITYLVSIINSFTLLIILLVFSVMMLPAILLSIIYLILQFSLYHISMFRHSSRI